MNIQTFCVLGSDVGWAKATDEPMFNGSGVRQPTNGSQRISDLTVSKMVIEFWVEVGQEGGHGNDGWWGYRGE